MTDNPKTRWMIRRDGRPLHAVDTRQDAETIGQLLIRAETCDPTVRIRWVCPVCDSEDDACPTCGDELPVVLAARGIITTGEYTIEPIRPTTT